MRQDVVITAAKEPREVLAAMALQEPLAQMLGMWCWELRACQGQELLQLSALVKQEGKADSGVAEAMGVEADLEKVVVVATYSLKALMGLETGGQAGRGEQAVWAVRVVQVAVEGLLRIRTPY